MDGSVHHTTLIPTHLALKQVDLRFSTWEGQAPKCNMGGDAQAKDVIAY